ncbi:D-glycero-alpha-D-manno-heptose 7-phosphate kinase [Enhygromyxa salina]|uniref:D-glycero-alpha-D-manno-heptose 7-phosphate kinase n=1 Tax=Enhygromyxa salina TaxID=215803 RepID=A0A2S9YAF5_9BACT|nr:GHMP kinase [Enhygromyxa salina]PRQ02094.1 D-glycero-alpha-D-manno-heptose 7-phosphate kinase [Enhygromyxa salina]
MITTRTPLRASFVGGGTDLPSYYREHGGAVVSTALRLYVDVSVRQRPALGGPRYRLACGTHEEVDNLGAIEHPIVREALRMVGVDAPLDIVSHSDVPSGTGLGSSSSFAVGLLLALQRLVGRDPSPATLARQAFELEVEILAQPIGRQDQTIAAFGGLRHIRFAQDERVDVGLAPAPRSCQDALEAGALLFYLGGQRRAGQLLRALSQPSQDQRERLRAIAGTCEAFAACLARGGSLAELGAILDETWQLKRRLSPGVSPPRVDAAYAAARAAGAHGAKLLGAGGTGCLLILAEPAAHGEIRRALGEFAELPFRCAERGAQVLLEVEGEEGRDGGR